MLLKCLGLKNYALNMKSLLLIKQRKKQPIEKNFATFCRTESSAV